MKKRTPKRKPLISALEPRILFDGAAVATAVDVLDNSSYDSSNENASTTDETSNDSTSANNVTTDIDDISTGQTTTKDKKEVAFVDSNVENYKTLVDGIDSNATVYVVDSLDEIKEILSSLKDVDAIHILSHGDTGEITIGEDTLNSNSLDTYTEVLESIKESMSENGDLLLYGCNVASDGEGQEFIDSLANLTKADVAASDDITGAASLGGDWDLEASSGLIETEAIAVEAYDNTLYEDFSGTDDMVTVATGSSTAITGDITIEVRASVDSLSSSESTLVFQGVGNTDENESENITYSLRIHPSGYLNMFFEYDTGTNTSVTSSVEITSLVSSLSDWHTYTAVRDTSTSTVTFYVDGTQLGSVQSYSNNATGGNSSTVELDVGAENRPGDSDTIANELDGKIQYVKIWDSTSTSGTALYSKTWNIAPTITSTDTSVSVDENTSTSTAIYTFTATDPEESITWSLSGTDSSYFTIDSDGKLYFKSSPDYETDQTTYNITVTVTDNLGETDSTTLTINLNDINDAPTSADNSATIYENIPTILQTSEFSFSDDDGDTLASIEITSLATNGTLEYYDESTSSWVAVTLNQVITKAELDAGYLRFSSNENEYGADYTSFEFSVNDGTIDSSSSYTFTIDVTEKTSSLNFSSVYNSDVFLTNSEYADGYQTSDGYFDSYGAYIEEGVEGGDGVGNGGVISAISGVHPEVTLDIYSDKNAWKVEGTGSVTIDLEEGNFNTVHVFASAGDTGVGKNAYFKVTLNYSDGSYSTVALTAPDWFDTSAAPGRYQLISAMDRYSTDTQKLDNRDHFSIFGFAIQADNTKTLESMTINVTQNDAGVFAFYGGVATTQISNDTIETTYDPDASGNHKPTATDSTISIKENNSYTLTSSDFNYSDEDNDLLSTIKITSLPTNGSLEYYNGTSWEAVTENKIIDKEDIDAGYLKFTPTSDEYGDSYTSFSFKVNDGYIDSKDSYTLTVDVEQNIAPTSADKSITINKDNAYIFNTSDFAFSDENTNDSLKSITISTLPTSGTLEYYNGSIWTSVTADQSISLALLTNGNLRYTAGDTISPSFTFRVNDGIDNSITSNTITFSVNYAPYFGPEANDTSNGGNSSGTVKEIFANADFEDGLTGWTTNGNATALDKDTVTYYADSQNEMTDEVKEILGNGTTMSWTVDSAGSGMVKLEATGSSTEFDSTFQNASHVSDDTIDYIKNTFYDSSDKKPTNIAYITKTFDAKAGDTYSVAWNYVSGDYVPWNDGSVLTLVNDDNASSTAVLDGIKAEVVLLGATNPGTGNYTTASYGSTGWQTTQMQILESGTYTLTIAVFNLGDTSLNPYLYVDNITGTTTLNGKVFEPLEPDVNAPEAAGEEFIVESGITETDSTLSSSGIMSVNDINTTDTVNVYTTKVSATQKDSSNNIISSDSNEPTAEELLSMLSISPTTVIDSEHTSGSFTWNFNSGTEAFDYLEKGETLTLTYTFEADDGNGGVTEQTLDITITGTNDAPSLGDMSTIEIINSSNSSESFDNITGNVNATDIDDNVLTYNIINSSSQSVQTIIGKYGTLSLNSSTGEYTYTPNDTLLNSISNSVSETFTIKVTDKFGASDSEILTVKIPYVNVMPILGGEDSTVTFTENGSAVQIDPTITINDPEAADYNNGYIEVAYTAGQENSDTLTILNIGGISENRGNIYYENTLIGTVDSNLDGKEGTVLRINLNEYAYSQQVQALAQAISFINETDDLSETSREVVFKVNDGGDAGNVANYATKEATIEIVAINDLPEITLSNNTYLVEKVIGVNENGTFALTDISFDDLDGDTLTVTFETSSYGIITIKNSVTGGISSSNISGNGTSTVTLTGTIEAINTTLAANNGIIYTAGNGNDYITPGADYLKVKAVDENSAESNTSTLVMVLPAIPNSNSENITTKEDGTVLVDIESLVKDINDNSGTYSFGTGTADITDTNGNIISGGDGSLTKFDNSKIIYDSNSKPIGYQLEHGTLILSNNQSLDTDSANFIYTPEENWSGYETFVYQYTSGDGKSSYIAQINIFVAPVNDAPAISINNSDITLEEDGTYIFDSSNPINFADIENTGIETFKLTINVDNGAVSLSTLSGLTVLEGKDGTSKITIQGTLSDLQKAIDNLTYNPNKNYNGKDYLTIVLNDLGNSGSGGKLSYVQTVDINITPVEETPSNPPVIIIPKPIDDPAPKKGGDTGTEPLTERNKDIKEGNGVKDGNDGFNDNNNQEEFNNILDMNFGGDDINKLNITGSELTSFSFNTTNSNINDKLIKADMGISVGADGQVQYSDKANAAFETVGLKIDTINVKDNYIEIKIIDSRVGQKYIATLADGSDLPNSLTFDPNTGIVRGTLPEGMEELEISIKALSSDGTTRILTIKIDVKNLIENNNQAEFKTLSDQIQAQNDRLNNYGVFITNLFDSSNDVA